METIRLRVAGGDCRELEETLQRIAEDTMDGKVAEIKLYQHATVRSDGMIVIKWESGNVELQGSDAGRCITHLLKSSVLASHAVWVEKE
jgi:hypothetical protein